MELLYKISPTRNKLDEVNTQNNFTYHNPRFFVSHADTFNYTVGHAYN